MYINLYIYMRAVAWTPGGSPLAICRTIEASVLWIPPSLNPKSFLVFGKEKVGNSCQKLT